MHAEIALTAAGALLMSALLTGAVRKFIGSYGVIDVPNERSSHKVPTPRGGGVAIVGATTAVFPVLAALGFLRTESMLAVTGGGVAVALVGFLDDRLRLSAGVRLTVHSAAALWALAWLGGLPPVRIGDQVVALGWSGYVVGVLGIVWALNLFNFMDGIDGIAASEAAFIACCGALLAIIAGHGDGVSAAGIVFGAACCGFLLWNWPPAKIFMGDVGSGYIGYVIAVLAVVATRENPAALWVWLILGGTFFVDATVTLLRRMLRRERVHEAHRSHAYQWLARRWGSHRRVTVSVLVLNLVWLLPCALLATLYPGQAEWIAAGALVPVVVMALVFGSGRREIRIS